MCNHTPFVLHKFINDHAIDGYNHDTGRKFGNLIAVLNWCLKKFPVSMGYFVEWSEYLSNLLFAYVPLHKEILLLFAVKL